MKDSPDISYLDRASIDTARWDRCISSDPHAPVFATSWYLDHMSPGWEALVMGNYDTVMPLTGNRKYGIHYLFQPFLTPQTGIIGKNVSKVIVNRFVDAIPGKFKFVEINLNTSNNFPLTQKTVTHDNYEVDISPGYDRVTRAYNENLKRNIRKASKMGCDYREGIPLTNVLRLAKSQLDQYTTYRPVFLTRFRALCEFMIENKYAFTCGVYRDDTLLASAVMVRYRKRLYYVIAGNNDAGKSVGASHFLFDEMIRKHAGKDAVLDFCGSDFASIARFYQSFGAKALHYPSVKMNKLPVVLKWMKK